jgi:hypothetical protein
MKGEYYEENWNVSVYDDYYGCRHDSTGKSQDRI